MANGNATIMKKKIVGSLYLSCNGSWIDTDRSLCCGK